MPGGRASGRVSGGGGAHRAVLGRESGAGRVQGVVHDAAAAQAGGAGALEVPHLWPAVHCMVEFECSRQRRSAWIKLPATLIPANHQPALPNNSRARRASTKRPAMGPPKTILPAQSCADGRRKGCADVREVGSWVGGCCLPQNAMQIREHLQLAAASTPHRPTRTCCGQGKRDSNPAVLIASMLAVTWLLTLSIDFN